MDIIRKYADAGDIVNLRYVFSGAFDADPTFEQYEDGYQYCKRKGVFEEHREMTSLTNDKTRWTEDYWYKVQGDLKKNLSDKRLTHMKDVAKVVFKDKVERLKAERAAKKRPLTPVAPIASTPDVSRPPAESRRTAQTASETWEQRIERENREAEAEMRRANQAYAESQRRAENERQNRQRMNEQRRPYAGEKTSGGGLSKKAVGIAAIIAFFLILLTILLATFLSDESSRNPQTNFSNETPLQEEPLETALPQERLY